MTFEQLQNKLLPILFDDNDKFEDVNRANIIYDRVTDQIIIKRTKFDKTRCSDPDLSTLQNLTNILGCNVSYKCTKNKNYSRLVFTVYKASLIFEVINTPSMILNKFKFLESKLHESFGDEEWLNFKVISKNTERALLKFQELLLNDLDNFNE